MPDGLIPCPFCGGEVMRRDALWPSEGDRDAVIHAEPSDCPLRVFEDDTWGGSLYGRWNGGLMHDREKVAALMMRLGIATGHGDTIDDLLWVLETHLSGSFKREYERGRDDVPTNAFHAECPACGAKVDVIPASNEENR